MTRNAFLVHLFIACSLIGGVAQAGTVTLPIEVLGPDGTIQPVTLTVPTGGSASIDGLWLQINNLSYPNALTSYAKASVQINNGPWTDLTNTNVQVQGLAKNWEGIGGPFNTIQMILPIPSGTVVDGNNTINFRFNYTDGISAGYRVINFYFTSGGTQVQLPGTTFVNDNPSQWTAPADGNAANGKTLWTGASLVSSPSNQYVTPHPIGAKCMNCHATDGGDLKYFNYSNKSIQARAVFHGLTAQQGDDIAAYIRTLNTYQSVNGRPWNPVYQPGPGLDSQPIQEWAAGAGINAVLENDQAILPYLFPNGISESAISATTMPPVEHNVRQIPTAMQYLDWNHWLPRIYPGDSWTDFVSNPVYTDFYGQGGLLNYLQTNGANSGNITAIMENGINGSGVSLATWATNDTGALYGYLFSKTQSLATYSLAQWGTVKTWELMNEFNMQGLAQYVNGYYNLTPSGAGSPGYTIAEPRSWLSGMPFFTSPHKNQLPQNAFNDSKMWNFLADFWYRMQVNLYTDRMNVGHDTIDVNYLLNFIANNSQSPTNGGGTPNIMQFLTMFTKVEEIQNNGWAPAQPANSEEMGWEPEGLYGFDVSYLVNSENGYPVNPYAGATSGWANTPASTRQQLGAAYLGAWLDKSLTYPTTDYYASDEDGPMVSTPTYSVFREDGQLIQGEWGERIWGMVPYYRALGVSETLLQQVINFGQQLYPLGPWSVVRNTSLLGDPAIKCQGGDSNPSNDTITSTNGSMQFQCSWTNVTPSSAPPMGLYVNGVRVAPGTFTSSNNSWNFNYEIASGSYTVDVRAQFPVGAIGGQVFAATVTGGTTSTSPCDINGDGSVNVLDVQQEVNMALGVSKCLNPDGQCTVVQVQDVINAALGGQCVSP